MKKTVLIVAVAVLLMSCGKVPQEKYDLAKSCMDSLANVGAKSSVKFDDLQDRMKIVDENIYIQESKLFKEYNFVSGELDNIIRDSRRFIITYDRPAVKPVEVKDQNSNIVRLEVELTFENSQDALKVASDIDEAVRRISLAKLVNVKIIQ